MAAAKVTLTVVAGPHAGKRFVFTGPTRCLAGRGEDCAVRLSGSLVDSLLSRHHCELSVNPPHVRVRDLGSSNGTFLNGRWIGGGDADRPPGPEAAVPPGAFDLHDGDELRLGPIPFRVTIAPKANPDAAG
jgi:pSer/pThr/pTyr-binding forkhead associated (FHA) protein